MSAHLLNPPNIKVGTDITLISRMQKSMDRFGFGVLERFLCEEEIKIAKNIKSIAGLWAAKEAVSKALGCGIGAKCSFFDIRIYKNELGAPMVILSDEVKAGFGVLDVSVSISHDAEYAIAVAAVVFRS
ncbi:holo-ACP synthase [Campylobacter sp. 19-13652]|uniref:holo-ACP synthase n=1 Tax=Campylobacter sp. 19-13652 TaxID=2840180 RepID=UPI001C771892|nr:holo-ACP synthase [Campylobacter sp. 19-13652]BCX79492.1 holo-[acyl-carrier-protein] synthase [Campylobacter sp. 19-13652]